MTCACLEQSQVETVFDPEADLHKAECELQQKDVDLQSAVARLAAIRSAVQDRDLRHLRLQDLQVGVGGVHHSVSSARFVLFTSTSYVLVLKKLQEGWRNMFGCVLL